MKNTLVNKDAKLIIGSPGCGKTTRLMEIIEQDLASGVRINEIGFVSFSTAAINEALTRLGKKFGIKQGNVAYFKTLHSMGFLFLDYKRNQTLTPGKLASFGASVGLNLSNRGFKDREADGFATEDDKLLQLINISRLFGCTLEEAAAYHGMVGKVDVGKAKLVREMYEAYKYQKGLHDFTDMIYNAVHQDCPIPFLKRLIVDEAQDLSRLQWELVFKMAENADSIVIAGDDKQCINNFAGADIETFLNLGIPVEALEQSYRIPVNVHKLALNCLDHIGERYEVAWKPKPEEGNVFRISALPYREIISSNETWMILSRNKSSINKLVEYLYFMKFPFSVNRQPPFDAILYTCIKNYINYKTKKKDLSDAQKRIIDSYMVGGIEMLDEHEDWQSAFRGHLDGDLEGYLEYCLENDLKDKDFVNARVRLSTIHSAKGSEADNVVLINEFSEAVEENLIYEPETEYKILFVAVTRAKHNLFILETDSKRRYRI